MIGYIKQLVFFKQLLDTKKINVFKPCVKKNIALFVFGFLYIFCLSKVTFAADVISPKFAVIPQEIYTGDLGEIRCTFASQTGLVPEKYIKNTESDPLYLSTDFVITEISLLENSGVYTLSVMFQPLKAGVISLPTIDVGPFSIPLGEITVNSVLSLNPNATFKSFRPPILLPKTKMYLYFVILAVVVVIALFIVLIYFFRGRFPEVQEKRNKKRRFSLLKKSLMLCQKKGSLLKTSEQYRILAKELRMFLFRRWNLPFLSASGAEILTLFKKGIENEFGQNVSNASLQAVLKIALSIEEFFKKCDAVRFGGVLVTEEEKKKDFDDVLRWAIEVDSIQMEKLDE